LHKKGMLGGSQNKQTAEMHEHRVFHRSMSLYKNSYFGNCKKWQGENSVPTKILVCLLVPKKLAVLACLTMSKLKMSLRVPNKSANLLKNK